MLVSWNWLKEYLGETKLSATKAAELLGAHAFELEGIEEKGDDTIIAVDILPNRGSDCLCQRGVARELSSITGIALAHDPLAQAPVLESTDLIEVSIEDPVACPRFTASVIAGIEVKESPEWLQKRLAAIGQRSINNIVDATNYVMFAIGQPIHAYDAELFPQVDGKWKFDVRYARPGEVVSLLAEGGRDEDRNITLAGTETLIVDGSSDTPIGLAGVKGGRFAGVHSDTKSIIVEAAHFHPTITRKTARGLGIVIDASKRFENEPSRELPPYAQAEIIKLITDIAGGQSEGVVDVYLKEQNQTPVDVRLDKVNQLLGLSLDIEEVIFILEKIGATVRVDESTSADHLIVIGPWERTDLLIEEDFIEEIGRLHGYSNIIAVAPESAVVLEYNQRHYYSEQVRQVLFSLGFSEVITSSFCNKDQVQLKNALASDKSCLRSTLTKNLIEALDRNAGFTDLLGTTDTRLFEIGTVFSKGEGMINEYVSLAVGIRIKPSGYNGKEDAELSKTIAAINDILGAAVVWSQEKGVAEMNLTAALKQLPKISHYEPVVVGAEISYRPFSIYPHMSRDIALWVSEGVTAAEVEKSLNQHAGALRVRTTLFDEFSKDGKTSFAFRLVFQSIEKTLTDNEVGEVMDVVYAAVKEQGWEVR